MKKYERSSQKKSTGEKMILSALSMDEALAELLKAEVKNLKKMLGKESFVAEAVQMNHLLKKIIAAMMMTEEKIAQGIEIYKLEMEEKK